MVKEFLLPELAESVVEGEIVKWLINEGEPVEEDQPLVEVMTDKVTVELPSPYRGVLEKQLVKEGQVVPVNTPLARIVERSAAAPQAAPEPAESADEGERLSLFKPSQDDSDEPVFQVRRQAPSAPRARAPFGRVLAVPAARKLARELGIDLAEVPGSGPNGRIRLEDVRQFAERAKGALSPSVKPALYHSGPYREREERLPLRGLRRAISQQMLASHLQTVRTLHVDEADVSALVALREKLKGRAEAAGV